MEKSLSYQDICLVPRYSEVKTRSAVDISQEFLGRKWKSPVCLANMSSVINDDIAKWLSENDYFYAMHRFGDTEKFVIKASKENWKTISISVGVKNEDIILIDYLSRGGEFAPMYKREKLRIDYMTVDIAHGHCKAMKEMIEFIKIRLPSAKIIAGNVATPEAVRDLERWGADAVKVGIGGGTICSTKNMTGFHVPMFACVANCAAQGGPNGVDASIPIIADGGIRENGDIAKALVAGATMAMVGGLFAACVDAPGESVKEDPEFDGDKITHKRYHGSASAKQKGHDKNVEGFELEIPCNGLTIEQKYQEIKESLQSSCSYAGGENLGALNFVGCVKVK